MIGALDVLRSVSLGAESTVAAERSTLSSACLPIVGVAHPDFSPAYPLHLLRPVVISVLETLGFEGEYPNRL